MKKLTPIHITLLRLILENEKSILANLTGETTVKSVDISPEGVISVYFRDGPEWWQRIWNTYKRISITESSIKIIKSIFDKQDKQGWTGRDYSEFVLEIIKKASLEEDLPAVVDALFDVIRISDGSPLRSSYIAAKSRESGSAMEFGEGVDGINTYCYAEIRPGVVTPIMMGKIRRCK